MSRIGLLDVDGHNFPNLCQMKLSAWHKAHGDIVERYDPYGEHYDAVYLSKVFSDTYSDDYPYAPYNCEEVICGGTGYAIKTIDGREVYHKELDAPLPDEIEHICPDYSLYPAFPNTAYGFLTRGCPRGCGFCHVAPKEGKASRKVADLNEFWNGQKNIVLLDPNILGCREADELLQQLVNAKAAVEFSQGLDARFITPDRAKVLATMRMKDLHFAMDTMRDIDQVAYGLENYKNAMKDAGHNWTWKKMFVYVLVNYDTTVQEDLERIYLLRNTLEYMPYVMVYDKPNCDPIYRRIQRWCNWPRFAAAFPTFEEFQSHIYKSQLEVPK